MMNEASIRPSSRNTLPCSELVSSGWRAAASRKRLHMMPTPTHAPSAPRPIIRPMPIAGVGLDHGEQLKFFHLLFSFLSEAS